MRKGLFIGLCGLDLIFYTGKKPFVNSKIKTNEFTYKIGGPASNAALTFKKMCIDTNLISYIGNSYLRIELEDNKINYLDLSSGDKGDISVVLVNKEDNTRSIISGQNIREYRDFEIGDYDFCLYDCNLPILNESIVRKLKEKNIPLFLDCGSWKDNMDIILEYADCVISSDDFVSPQGKDIFLLQEEYKIPYAAKTNNEKPIEYSYQGNKGKVEVKEIKNIDTSGAGDIFHGLFAYYFYIMKENFITSLDKAGKKTGEILNER